MDTTTSKLSTQHVLRVILVLSLLACGLFACVQDKGAGQTEPQYTAQSSPAKEYVFAIHPLHNPARLFEIYGPLVDYLNRNISDTRFRLEASRNYAEFDKMLYARKFDFALPNPYQTLNSLGHGYHVIAKMGDDEKFTGIILIRRDSGVENVTDLKCKRVSIQPPRLWLPL